MKATHQKLASVGSFLIAGAANAEFLSVEIYNMNHWFGQDINVGGGAVQTAFNAANLDTYRVYALFSAPLTVENVFGDPQRPMYISNLDSGSFYNYIHTEPKGMMIHYDTQQTSGFAAAPGKAFDTFATIGQPNDGVDHTQFGAPGVNSDNGGVGDHFQYNWTSDEDGHNGYYSWHVALGFTQATATQNPEGLFSEHSPHSPETPNARYYVLLFQLTVPRGEDVEGQLGVSPFGRPSYNDERNFFTTATVPTPGAIAMLGLAGVAGTRRRKL